MVYLPAEDSFLLADVLRKIKPFGNRKALDMGTGTGIQGIVLARNGWSVTCSDIDPEALDVAGKRFRQEGLEAEFVLSNLFESITGKFSLIAFNMPYLPAEGMEDRATDMPTDLPERFLEGCREHLLPGGRAYLVFSSFSGDIKRLAEKMGWKCEIVARKRLFFEEIYVCQFML